MRYLEFRVGAKILLHGEEVVLIDFMNKNWVLHYVVSGKSEQRTHVELLELYDAGSLKGLGNDSADASAIPDRSQRSIRDLGLARREGLELKLKAIDLVNELRGRVALSFKYTDKNPFNGKLEEKSALDHVLAKVAYEGGLKRAIGRSTYFGWQQELAINGDPLDMVPQQDGRGRARSLDPDVIKIINQEVYGLYESCNAQIKGGVHPNLKKSELTGNILTRVGNELPGKAAPSRATVYRTIAALPAYQRDVIDFGPTRARNNYRMTMGREAPEHCLDDTEYDESTSRIFVFCEDTQVALGRAIFSWFICTTTAMPLGFYVGYEPMSDVATMAAWKHAVLPKLYVKKHYPNINNEWGARGILRSIRFDNGLSQHSDTIKATAFDLGRARLSWTRPYFPWFKSAVEGFHHQLNDCLLDQLPGGIPHARFRHKDYDPSENGCIGLRHLIWIMHKWLIDIHIQKPRGILKISPARAWKDAIEIKEPSLPAGLDNINLFFGIRKKARLDHRGVRFHLDYIADWMEQYRKDFGRSIEVDINVYSPNMGYIYVRHPDYGWLPARCKQFEIAEGRSLEYIKKLVAHSNENFKSSELPALLASQKELCELAAFALEHAKSIALNKEVARTFGIGTDTLFAGHTLSGEMGPSTGYFAGQSINPMNLAPELEKKSSRARPAAKPTAGAPARRRVPKGLTTNQTPL